LEQIYGSYGKAPTDEFKHQFQDYDATGEKNLWQGFWGKVGGAFQGAQGAYSEVAGQARQAGASFAGAGTRGQGGVRGERRGILGEFVGKVQGDLVPGLQSKIQTKRDAYTRDVAGALAGLETTEGALESFGGSEDVFVPEPFPTEPSTNQLHYDGQSWFQWNGTSWIPYKGDDPEDSGGHEYLAWET